MDPLQGNQTTRLHSTPRAICMEMVMLVLVIRMLDLTMMDIMVLVIRMFRDLLLAVELHPPIPRQPVCLHRGIKTTAQILTTRYDIFLYFFVLTTALVSVLLP